MEIQFPLRIDGGGLLAEASEDEHIQQMIKQVVCTSRGERVNRPDFGCDLRRLVFADRQGALLAAVEATVQGALQQWLGERIRVESVDMTIEESLVTATVRYVDLRTGQARLVRLNA